MRTQIQDIPELVQKIPQVFARLEEIFVQEQKVAVAVSGGSDSMLLAFILMTYWSQKKRNLNQLFFLHCNHKIRTESDYEQQWIQDFFSATVCKVFVAEGLPRHTEDALRTRRYEQFAQYMQENDISTLSMGHHLQDRVEGTLLNLARGCGINGLIGMQDWQSHHLLQGSMLARPLLQLSKQEILLLCEEFSIPFVQDQTNFESQVSLRNQIRNEIFPIFEHLGQGKFMQSWALIYQELQSQRAAQSFFHPIKMNPYWPCKRGFECKIPVGKIVDLNMLVQAIVELGVSLRQGELKEFHKWLKQGKSGFRQVQ